MTSASPAEAAGLTPSLFLGEALSLPHVTVSSARQAVEVIRSGGTALTDSRAIAMATMLQLGIAIEVALRRLCHATQIVDGDVGLPWHLRDTCRCPGEPAPAGWRVGRSVAPISHPDPEGTNNTP